MSRPPRRKARFTRRIGSNARTHRKIDAMSPAQRSEYLKSEAARIRHLRSGYTNWPVAFQFRGPLTQPTILMFNPEKFIELIETKECLWKISHKHFLNSNVKIKAWHEVGQEMYLEWHTLAPMMKAEKCLEMQSKWRNIRNALKRFLRQQKTETLENSKREYLFCDILQYLLAQEEKSIKKPPQAFFEVDIKEEGPEEANLEEWNSESNQHEESTDANLQDWYNETNQHEVGIFLENQPDSNYQLENFSTQREIHNSLEQKLIILSNVQETDEDISFFNSLLPGVRKLSNQQKIDFRLEVLYALKKFQNLDADSVNYSSNYQQYQSQ